MRNSYLAPSQPRRNGCLIEALESRIAPALILVGQTGFNDTEYKEGPGFGMEGTDDDPTFLSPFVDTSDPSNQLFDPISAVLGTGLYYIKLTTGDTMAIFSESGYTNFISGPNGSAIKGNVIAIFQDLNNDYEIQPNELVGLALGNNVRVQVSGIVNGDVIANYNDVTGLLGGPGDTFGSATDLLQNSIGHFGATAVNGTIAAGGDIKSLNLTNSVVNIFAGNAAHNYTYNINGTGADNQMLDVPVPAVGKRGPSISNVTVGDFGRMQAGEGGPQAAGGNITNVIIVADTNGWIIKAGDGGQGTTSAPKGGAGGKVSNILANGLDESQSDATQNSLGGMQVLAGDGGDAFSGSNGVGGRGGDITGVSIGYEKSRGSIVRSVNPMNDAVLVKAGDGGDGRTGGAGGKLANSKAFASPVGVGNDVTFQAGTGGAGAIAGGKAGAGGSLNNLIALIPENGNGPSGRAMFLAGDGGDTTFGLASGAAGGSIKGISITAFSAVITAGDGSTGIAGGVGGSVTNVRGLDGFMTVSPMNFVIDAGSGGSGTVKRGGNGGSVTNVTLENAELAVLDVNQGALSGNGGSSAAGNGGIGGSVTRVVVLDERFGSGQVRLRAGDGGAAGTASANGNGGKGGSISGNNVISGFGLSVTASAGSGGDALFKGAGGAGGSVTNFAFVELTDDVSVGGDAFVSAGSGGAGADTGAGGKGGNIQTIELISDGMIAVSAGTGGNGGFAGTAGSGGNIKTAAFQAPLSVTVSAGNAGSVGIKKGNGGAVTNANLLAGTAISVTAGNGFAGGAGGNITGVGVTNFDQTDGPLQSIAVIAGSGSGLGAVAGNGGSINKLDGFLARNGQTIVRAGDGGAGMTKSGNGGSITDVNFLGGGSATAEVRIEAGSALDTAGALKGGKGGNVTGIGIGLMPSQAGNPFAVHPDTVIRYIAAGNGASVGAVGGTGGVGGSVNEVRVNHDIGVRSGEAFGFSTMGGIFAGAGGSGSKFGFAGNVTNISADGIASIVAGRPEIGAVISERNLANVVGDIVLNGSSHSVVNGSGQYLNLVSGVPGLPKANILGAVVDPGAAGANTFDAGINFTDNGDTVFGLGDTTTANTDGFVAAYKFLDAKGVNSVRPEALLTLNPLTGLFELIDLNNTNGQKVIS